MGKEELGVDMTQFIIKALINLSLSVWLCFPSLGVEDLEIDIQAQIKHEALNRYQTLWSPLTAQNYQLIYGVPAYLPKKIAINETSNNLERAIYRPSNPGRKGSKVSTAIPYVVCTSEDVKAGIISPKGVIIKAYGAGIPMDIKNNSSFQEEKLWAVQDYIVYCLNLRGTEGFGDNFLHAQGQAHAVQSLVRDISYFIYLLKSQKKDIRGHSAIGSNFVKADTPCFLTGASFGGYLALFHATNPEDRYFMDQFSIFISHRQLFTGYIASMPLTDIWRDAKSGTEISDRRLEFFTFGGVHSWMKNAYKSKNVVDYESDNQDLSPLFRMSKLERPVLFLHGGNDTNVSPKQTVDCIKSALNQGTGDKVFVYFDGALGHSFPNHFDQIKGYYEMIFRFMDGARLAEKHNQIFSSCDSLVSVNTIIHLRTRALNPHVHRPAYQFLYEAIRTFYYGSHHGLIFEQIWHIVKDVHGDFFLKAIVWMKEKEKVNFDRQNRRNYLFQKRAFKLSFLVTLKDLSIENLFCGSTSNRTLRQYYTTYNCFPTSSLATGMIHNGSYGNPVYPTAITYYQHLVQYLGDGNQELGAIKLSTYESTLKSKLYNIMYQCRLDLIVQSPVVATRLGI